MTANATAETTVPIEGVGLLHLTPDVARRNLRVDYGTYAPSEAAIYQRLRRKAAEGMRQLATHRHLPGVLVLDVDACGLARNGLSRLERWAGSRAQLGAAIVIEREYSGRAAYGNVRVLPGPRVHEVTDIAEAFEVCEAGHVHYQPLCTPARPCPSGFWLSRVA